MDFSYKKLENIRNIAAKQIRADLSLKYKIKKYWSIAPKKIYKFQESLHVMKHKKSMMREFINLYSNLY